MIELTRPVVFPKKKQATKIFQMRNPKLVILPFFLFLLSQNINGQSVRRSVISSFGDSGTPPNGLYFSCTSGQPPNAGTIQNGAIVLRQGFQQPVSDGDFNPDCVDAPMAEFIVDFEIDACGQSFDFQYAGAAEPGTFFLWDFGLDALPPTSTQMNPTGVVYTSTGQKVITLLVLTDSCEFSAAYNANVIQASFGAASEATDVNCAADQNGTAKLTPINGETPYIYAWSNGETTPIVNGLGLGTYGFTVTDGTGCTFSGEQTVGGPDSILAVFAVKAETCTGESNGNIDATVNGGVAPYFFQWSGGGVTEDLNKIPGGEYGLAIIDAQGCQANFQVEVPTTCEDWVFDDLITPNGDGANDTWTIPNISDFPKNELVIFSRWGDKVFDKTPYDNSWQGTNNSGKPLPIGAYFFTLKLNDTAETVYTGSVSILR